MTGSAASVFDLPESFPFVTWKPPGSVAVLPHAASGASAAAEARSRKRAKRARMACFEGYATGAA